MLRKLFSKDEPFIPTPSQQIPGLEPIVVHVVEILFPNPEDQKRIFKDLLEKSKNADTRVILSLLSFSEGKIEEYQSLMKKTPFPITDEIKFYLLRDSGFFKMNAAEKWVKSITKSQA